MIAHPTIDVSTVLRVFISYRRSDARDIAGRLCDRLCEHFGTGNVFYDVDSILPGMDFREAIRSTIDQTDVVVALMGSNWEAGRLGEPNDFVRTELEEALTQGKLVIPVLAGERTEMPAPSDLPDSLRQLSFLNATRLRPDPDFRSDAAQLIEDIQRSWLVAHEAARGAEAPHSAAAVRPSGPAATTTAPTAEPAPPRAVVATRRAPASRRTTWILGASLAIALLVLGAVAVIVVNGAGRSDDSVARLDHSGSVNAVAFSPSAGDDLLLASASDDGTVRVWDRTGSLRHTLSGHENSVRSVAFSPSGVLASAPDGLLASASEDSTVRLWHARTGTPAGVLRHDAEVTTVAFSSDGTLASASDDGSVRLWDADTGALRQGPLDPRHTQGVPVVTFSPDGTILASASDDGSVRLWDARTGKQLHEPLAGHEGGATAIAFSPDGAILASASAVGAMRLWDPVTGQEVARPTGHDDSVNALAFSPDGTILVSASSDRTVRLWDALTGAELRALTGHEDTVRAAVFDPGGAIVASAGNDTTIRFWEAASGAALDKLAGHEDAVIALAFSPDGTLLASASYDGTARLWGVPGSVTSAPALAATTLAPGGAVVAEGFERVVVRVTDDAGHEQESCFFVAATSAQRQRGLVEVTSLGEVAGMLFRFEADTTEPFYMYRTILPLTIAWYGADGGFVSTSDMTPCRSDDPAACPLYSPLAPYRDALEVPQGMASTIGVVPGSRIVVTDQSC